MQVQIQKRKTYDTRVKYLVRFGLLPNYYEKMIHKSLISKWKREAPDKYTGYELNTDISELYEVMKSLSQDEKMLKTEEFPPISVILDQKNYLYQYFGGKVGGSYLPGDSYTKVIEGYDKDFREAQFKPGKQIFFFFSCENVYYFKDTIRAKFDIGTKLVYGTKNTSYWSAKPEAVFVYSLITSMSKSQDVVSYLNATDDCGADCFLTY